MSSQNKYPWYTKDVRAFAFIDIYRVLELFEVKDPALAHAAKKILVAGKRGEKSSFEDIREARDALDRWLDMRDEDGLGYVEDLPF